MQEAIRTWFDDNGAKAKALAHDIWGFREAPLKEFKTTEAVEKFMKDQGFEVKKVQAENKGGEPNTVVATWGSGKPVIGILGEFDALPGLGQEAVPYHSPLPGPGHGCGHCHMATSGAAASAALKAAMEAEKLSGTIKYVGCPAEETLQGKVYLARDGYFSDMDLCLIWHPGSADFSMAEFESSAVTSIVYKFTGKTAHAAAAWGGRSALDAAELTSVGSQYLREHMTEDCRIHHMYPKAGEQPNIVPEHAEIYFYIRSKDDYNEELARRMKLIAEGAAMMTETKVDFEMKAACHGYTYLNSLMDYAYEAALKVPRPEYTAEEYAFAREMYKNVTGKEAPANDQEVIPSGIIKPTGKPIYMGGSTDVGECCYIAPTIHLSGMGMVNGLPSHHWSVVAASGMGIGEKAMIFGAETIAQLGYDALTNPNLLPDCKKEFGEKFKDKPYKCRLV